ncbi:MAG: hypothetical protein ACYCVL_10355 [Gemmatimonadaceae bacterium]
MPTFHGADGGQAHRAADLVRNRVADAFPRRELRVVSAGDVADWLEKSGFDEDTAFLPSEARDMLAASPSDPIALEQLGLALDTRGAFADAAQARLRLLATDSLNGSLLQQVVEALSREGNARLAEPIVVRGSDANPEDLPLLTLR